MPSPYEQSYIATPSRVSNGSPVLSEYEDDEDELYKGDESDAEVDDPNVFKIRGALPAPSAKLYTLRDLHGLSQFPGLVDLNLKLHIATT